MNKSYLSFVFMLMLAGLVLAGVFLLRNEGDADAAKSRTAEAQSTASVVFAERQVDLADAALDSERSVASAQASIEVRAAESGSPIPLASVTLIPRGSHSSTLRDSPHRHADDGGRIDLSELSLDGKVAVVRAPGRVPMVLEPGLGLPGAMIASLAKSGGLQMSLISEDGIPVEGAWATLAAHPSQDAGLGSGVMPEPGIGHPLAASPVWVSELSGQEGIFLDELPPGRYFLDVWHHEMLPLTMVGMQSILDVSPGINRLHLTMQGMYGVAFQCPHTSPVVRVDWGPPLTALDRSRRVLSRISVARPVFQERFPGCQVFVHRPSRTDRDPAPVHCLVTCADSTLWRGSWPLLPVGSIRVPVYLEQDLTPVKEVVLLVRDDNGNKYDNIVFRMFNKDSKLGFDIVSGGSVVVPYGTYEMTPKTIIRQIYLKFVDYVVAIDELSPEVLTVDIGAPMTQVVIRPKIPDDAMRGYLGVSFTNGPAIYNWIPANGPIRQLLAGDEIQFRVSSGYYEDVVVGPLAAKPGKELEVEVPLVPRSADQSSPGRQR